MQPLSNKQKHETMKNLLKFLLLTLVMSSCTPEDLINDPETNIPPKIKMVKLVKNGDTTAYTFLYNTDTTRLSSVLRDGDLYATLTYSTGEVLLTMALNTSFTDSFVAKLSSGNYIDSLKNPQLASFGLENPALITRGVNNRLFESRNYLNEYIKREGNFSGYTKQEKYTFNSEYSTSANNLRSYDAQAIQSIFSETYRDSIIYNLTQTNQPNLPDQFATNFGMVFYFTGKTNTYTAIFITTK